VKYFTLEGNISTFDGYFHIYEKLLTIEGFSNLHECSLATMFVAMRLEQTSLKDDESN
jgi:hypothetical protein